jgi:hypothetical protein
MEGSQNRVLGLVYRRRLADALRDLDKVESKLRGIQSKLDRVSIRKGALRDILNSELSGGQLKAADLQMDALDRELKQVELIRLRERETDLSEIKRKTYLRLDDAKDAVVREKKALNTILVGE